MKHMHSIGIAVAAAAVAVIAGCDDQEESPLAGTSYVLVHGSWMGAWAWDDVAPVLRDQGAKVEVVELPGHGADTTPVGGATLDAYVAAVTTAIDGAGGNVILVGHSFGGVVITQAAERMPAQIALLAYVGAFLPRDGESAFSLAMTDADSHLGAALTIDQGLGLAKVRQDALVDVFIADGTPAEQARLLAHYRDEPLAPLATPVAITRAGWGSVPKAYLYTMRDNAISHAAQLAMTAGDTFTTTVELDASHSPFLSQAEHVATTLADLRAR